MHFGVYNIEYVFQQNFVKFWKGNNYDSDFKWFLNRGDRIPYLKSQSFLGSPGMEMNMK